MLAEEDPKAPLHGPRLSEFSPELENSHGASNAHRIPPDDRRR
jgi:hypothetical protein